MKTYIRILIVVCNGSGYYYDDFNGLKLNSSTARQNRKSFNTN